MISDRDQQIRMLFLTQQVELASHGCVSDKRSHVSNRSRTATRIRGETRDHTCQSKKSYFSEYAVRHEITRVKSQLVLLPEYADNTILHVSGINGVRQHSAGNTTDR